MLQFLRFDGSLVARGEYPVVSGAEAWRLFSRRALYAFLLAYSTVFLAAAIPFDAAYFFGGLITGMVLIRLVNDIVKYRSFGGGKIVIDREGFEIFHSSGGVRVKAEDVTYCEVNVFGNMVVREKYMTTSFPLALLKKEDRQALLAQMHDMSPKRTEFFKKAYDFFDAVLVAFILAMHIRQFIIQAYYIPTGSMEDTLLVGDHLLVEKITYGPSIPMMIGMEKPLHLDFLGVRGVRRGDIIIFRPPGEEEKDFIKRCIAVEGDEYHIEDGSVWINGKRLEEPYVKGLTSYRGFGDRKIEGKVPAGMVIAMGDNRENSFDSRGFGYLPVERIKGRALMLYWNTAHIKNLDFSRLGLIR
ncbi:MAG: signal peptidase I [Spirochaetes bacterium]|jgi:signal peptidase I|nr:signal peptidase I [Spirochaetota bacterium]